MRRARTRSVRAVWLCSALALCLAFLAGAAAAEAQTVARTPVTGRLEVGIGAGILGSATLGERDANLRANSTTRSAFQLFSTETGFPWAPVLDARARLALTNRYGIEGGLSFARPELQTSVSSDAEDAGALVVSERIDQYLLDAGLFVTLDELRLGPLQPVVSGGAGYLRQLHEGRTLVEQGRFLYAGFGVRHRFTTGARGLLKGTGLRADARLYIVDGGIRVDEAARAQGAVSGSFFVLF